MTICPGDARQHVRWHPLGSADALASTVVRREIELARQAIEESGRFTIVLADGNTPPATYGRLRQVQTAWNHFRTTVLATCIRLADIGH